MACMETSHPPEADGFNHSQKTNSVALCMPFTSGFRSGADPPKQSAKKAAAENGFELPESSKPLQKKRGLKKKTRRTRLEDASLPSIPNRLHENLWYNYPLMGNEGAECSCSERVRNQGPHHGRFVLEDARSVWPSCRQYLLPTDSNSGSVKAFLDYAVSRPVNSPATEALTTPKAEAAKQLCDEECSLFHYILSINPGTNYVSDCARRTCIVGPDGKKYNFEGFLILSHEDMSSYPPPVIILFGYQYTLSLKPYDFFGALAGNSGMRAPDLCAHAHDVTKLDMLTKYITNCLLELYDWNLQPSLLGFPGVNSTSSSPPKTYCDFMHFMPCFRDAVSKRILPIQQILEYCAQSYRPVLTEAAENGMLSNAIDETKYQLNNESKVQISDTATISLRELKKSRALQNEFQQRFRGAIVHNPGVRPAALRVDQIEIELTVDERKEFEKDSSALVDENGPVIIHFGHKPAHLACCGNPEYINVYKKYQRLTHLNHQHKGIGQSAGNSEERERLREKLVEMRKDGKLKREVKCMLPAKNFHYTGLSSDIMQQALLLPVITFHYRYQRNLQAIEMLFSHKFKNRRLLQLALTHPSFRMTYGTNADHVRNSLTNCGARHMQYGPMHEQHQRAARKSGITTQTDIMSRLGSDSEQQSQVLNYERLEFLGDAVLEFLVSRRLYGLFPDFQEGVLATYRSALVDNAHLGFIAESLGFQNFLLSGHGSDLCSEMDMRHTLANCFEACIGALFLDCDADLKKADQLIGKSLFCYADEQSAENWPSTPANADEMLSTLQKAWLNDTRFHDFAVDDPQGDRYWLEKAPMLKYLLGFEKRVGFTFHRIRLLAKAFILKSSVAMYGAVTSSSVVAAADARTDGSADVGEKNNLNTKLVMPSCSTIPQIVGGNNERLEFLGDSVLQLMVSEHLYKHYPTHHEGHLSLLRSSLVSNNTLAFVCDELEMEKYQQLLLGLVLPSEAPTVALETTDLANISSTRSLSSHEISETKTSPVQPKKNPPSVVAKVVGNKNESRKRPHREVSRESGELSSDSEIGDSSYGGKDRRSFTTHDDKRADDTKKSMLKAKNSDELAERISPVLPKMTPVQKPKENAFTSATAREQVDTPPSAADFRSRNKISKQTDREPTQSNSGKQQVDITEQQQRRSKYKADLVEAFIGALYLDQGLDACYRFIDEYIITKAQRYIQEQRWTDPKSMLQQCCLTLRSVTSSSSGGYRKPDVPRYECVEESGPSNYREYRVAVYFRKEKLAEGIGRSIADAQADAAAKALQFKSIFATQIERTKQQIKVNVERQLEEKRKQQKNSVAQEVAVRYDRHGNVMPSSCPPGSTHSRQRDNATELDRHGRPRRTGTQLNGCEAPSRHEQPDRSRNGDRDRHGNERRVRSSRSPRCQQTPPSRRRSRESNDQAHYNDEDRRRRRYEESPSSSSRRNTTRRSRSPKHFQGELKGDEVTHTDKRLRVKS